MPLINSFFDSLGLEIHRISRRRGAIAEAPGYGDLEELFRSTEGMISFAEAKLLHDLAARVRDGVIVEVGVFRGRSTIALAAGSLSGGGAKIFSLDPHEPFTGVLGGQFGPADRGAFFKTMLDSNLFHNVRLINLPSQIVTPGWSEPVGLLWLDGDHSFEGVTRDFTCWAPHLLPYAHIAFDDSTDPEGGPHRLIDSLLAESGFREIEGVGKIRVLQRPAE